MRSRVKVAEGEASNSLPRYGNVAKVKAGSAICVKDGNVTYSSPRRSRLWARRLEADPPACVSPQHVVQCPPWCEPSDRDASSNTALVRDCNEPGQSESVLSICKTMVSSSILV